jgi:hypothetical protein
MAESKGKPGKTSDARARFGAASGDLLNNPFNANDELYEPGNTSKTLEGLSKNTIDHAGLPLRKGAYDKLWDGK